MMEGGISDAFRVLLASAIHPHRQPHLLRSDHHPRHELRIVINEKSVFDALAQQAGEEIQADT
jgi:hypothetical protein